MKKKVTNQRKKRIKPLIGNSRSFSNRANKRWFYSNKQTFKINGKIYKLTARDFRAFFLRPENSNFKI